MRTPLSSLGPTSRDLDLLLEPTFGRGDTGALDAGPLLSLSIEKSTSLPSRTRRTSLSLDAWGGVFEGVVVREPVRALFSGLAGSLPMGPSSLSLGSRLKLKTSLPPPASPSGSSGSLP